MTVDAVRAALEQIIRDAPCLADELQWDARCHSAARHPECAARAVVDALQQVGYCNAVTNGALRKTPATYGPYADPVPVFRVAAHKPTETTT